ncbi:hypothetical protein [Pseudomonas mosselii]|uniref:hypothetical protein n=1 Tax=Pseudomonas mosselii TaxID=78327 RepID=UPI0021DAC634|nr:hypothetical protein [Pseudomonas mosselii]MCU9528500.1 hypothetical protein [Pseudomonas mosselii]MCU9535834.1 hypothetical protein [Pseudomonas mosselii]MCU9543853.1 hypothetical protein [Pseudomonas mosselii]MCU9550438.1 hypothetical protein [Pseudomonas mosselii]
MQISFKKTTLALAALALVAVGAYATLKPADSPKSLAVRQVEEADMVKAAIVSGFASAPDAFNLPAASRRLANSRLEGYAVCTSSVEATAAQYIEVSELLDKAVKHVAQFQRAVNGVMDSKIGMTDCDFRVISAIGRVAVGH